MNVPFVYLKMNKLFCLSVLLAVALGDDYYGAGYGGGFGIGPLGGKGFYGGSLFGGYGGGYGGYLGGYGGYGGLYGGYGKGFGGLYSGFGGYGGYGGYGGLYGGYGGYGGGYGGLYGGFGGVNGGYGLGYGGSVTVISGGKGLGGIGKKSVSLFLFVAFWKLIRNEYFIKIIPNALIRYRIW